MVLFRRTSTNISESEEENKLKILKRKLSALNTMFDHKDPLKTRDYFNELVEDPLLTNIFLKKINSKKRSAYSGITSSILHQRKYILKKSHSLKYNESIHYIGDYAGALTLWNNESQIKRVKVEGNYGLMFAKIEGKKLFL